MRRTIQTAITFILLTASTVSTYSCNSGKKEVCFLLIDKSVSVADTFIRRAYSEDARKIITRLNEGDVVIINTITANSLATSTPRIINIPEYSFFGRNTMLHKRKLDSAFNEIMSAAAELISGAGEDKTDIINSIRSTAGILSEYDTAYFSRKLIILSDMEQYTEELDLSDISHHKGSALKLLDNLDHSRHSADLTGVRVIVAGAGLSASGNNSFDIAKTRFLQTFWIAYFRKCNASIKESDYGARYAGL